MAINNVVLVGRLTKDVELRQTNSGLQSANFNLAVDKNLSKEKEAEAKAQGRPTADFINCVAWRQPAVFLANYAKKGSMIAVEGTIQTRTYQNQAGQTVYVTEVVCDNVQLMDRPVAQGGVQPQVAQPQVAQPQAVQPQVAQPQVAQPAYQAPVQPQYAPPVAPQPTVMEEPAVALEISSDDLPFY